MGTIKSKIIKDSGLLLQEYSGELTKEDMSAYFTVLYKDPEYLHVTTIFSDFTKADASLSFKEISEVAFYILTHAPKVKQVNNAILVSKPLVTAYSMLYKTIMKTMPLYNSNVYSTFREAANFISYKEDELKELIKESFTD